MENKDVNGLEKTCIWELVPETGEPPRKNNPCLDCIEDCYLPEGMSPDKERAYKGACLDINSAGLEYSVG